MNTTHSQPDGGPSAEQAAQSVNLRFRFAGQPGSVITRNGTTGELIGICPNTGQFILVTGSGHVHYTQSLS